MQHIIDIDEERAELWSRVYSDMRLHLRNMSSPDRPYTNPSLPHPIISLFVDDGDVIVVNTHDGTQKLIEEYSDDVMFSIYNCLIHQGVR